ncbi:MAG: TIGR02147 family protein [Bdellovibrionota bacterium]
MGEKDQDMDEKKETQKIKRENKNSHRNDAPFLDDVSKVAVTQYLSYRDFLHALFKTIKKNRKYSYYQFSKDLGLSHSNVLWLVVSGRRKLIKPTANKIATALNLNATDKKYLLFLVDYNNTASPDKREAVFKKLISLRRNQLVDDEDQNVLKYLSEWYHPVIRELVGLDNFNSDPEWICSRLNVRLLPNDIKKSLNLLEKLELIAFDQTKNRFVQTNGQVMPDRNIANVGAIRFHQKMCEIARDSIALVPAERREINSLTVSVTEETAMEMSTILYKACQDIMKLENKCRNKDQVFQINMHLFPMTRKNN